MKTLLALIGIIVVVIIVVAIVGKKKGADTTPEQSATVSESLVTEEETYSNGGEVSLEGDMIDSTETTSAETETSGNVTTEQVPS